VRGRFKHRFVSSKWRNLGGGGGGIPPKTFEGEGSPDREKEDRGGKNLWFKKEGWGFQRFRGKVRGDVSKC